MTERGDAYKAVLVREKHRDKIEQLREQLEYADQREAEAADDSERSEAEETEAA